MALPPDSQEQVKGGSWVCGTLSLSSIWRPREGWRKGEGHTLPPEPWRHRITRWPLGQVFTMWTSYCTQNLFSGHSGPTHFPKKLNAASQHTGSALLGYLLIYCLLRTLSTFFLLYWSSSCLSATWVWLQKPMKHSLSNKNNNNKTQTDAEDKSFHFLEYTEEVLLWVPPSISNTMAGFAFCKAHILPRPAAVFRVSDWTGAILGTCCHSC